MFYGFWRSVGTGRQDALDFPHISSLLFPYHGSLFSLHEFSLFSYKFFLPNHFQILLLFPPFPISLSLLLWFFSFSIFLHLPSPLSTPSDSPFLSPSLFSPFSPSSCFSPHLPFTLPLWQYRFGWPEKKKTSIKWTVHLCWRNYIRYMKTFSQVSHNWLVFSSIVLMII